MEQAFRLRQARSSRTTAGWWAALVAVASALGACSRSSQPQRSIEEQLTICRRHERLEISRAEAMRLLGLPPQQANEAEGGIAGWLTYCRELQARHR